jgi:YD repeat-containing protein
MRTCLNDLRRQLHQAALTMFVILLCCSPLRAQSPNIAPPTETKAITPMGVDMRNGQYQHNDTDLQIGGVGGLNVRRLPPKGAPDRANPFGNFSHDYDIYMTRIQKYYDESVTAPDSAGIGRISLLSSEITVYLGNRSETFVAYGTATYFVPLSKKAAVGKLTYTGARDAASTIYSYEAQDGTLVTFRPLGSNDCSAGAKCAFATKAVYADGTEYNFSYDQFAGANSVRLRRVESNGGYAALFEYSGAYVTKSCVINRTQMAVPSNNVCPANAQQTSTYGYTTHSGRQKLASVTKPDGGVYSFQYVTKAGVPLLFGSGNDPAAFEMKFFKPGQSAPWTTNVVTYTPQNGFELEKEVVRSQSFATGESYSYDYLTRPGFTTNVYGSSTTLTESEPGILGGSYTNNLGQTVSFIYSSLILPQNFIPPPPPGAVFSGGFVYQMTPGPTLLIDELGRETATSFCRTSTGAPVNGLALFCKVERQPASVTFPNGNIVEYKYDGFGFVTEQRQKAVAGSGLADIVRTNSWADCANRKLCGKPLTITDAKGNVTSFTYDASHGGVLTETSPAVGGIAPQKRYEYTQRYAWVSNGAGGYVQATTPIWVKTKEEYCRTTAASSGNCAGGAADEVVTDYDYGPNSGPNNLLLRGMVVTADGQSLRTCYGYDALGRKISETQPNANLASCP